MQLTMLGECPDRHKNLIPTEDFGKGNGSRPCAFDSVVIAGKTLRPRGGGAGRRQLGAQEC